MCVCVCAHLPDCSSYSVLMRGRIVFPKPLQTQIWKDRKRERGVVYYNSTDTLPIFLVVKTRSSSAAATATSLTFRRKKTGRESSSIMSTEQTSALKGSHKSSGESVPSASVILCLSSGPPVSLFLFKHLCQHLQQLPTDNSFADPSDRTKDNNQRLKVLHGHFWHRQVTVIFCWDVWIFTLTS